MAKKSEPALSKDLFSGLDKESVTRFKKQMKKRVFKPGERIIVENTPATSVYYISRGRVEISKRLEGADKLQIQLAVSEKGDLFGEVSTFSSTPYYATVIALEEVEVLQIPHATFVEMCRQQPEFMLDLVRLQSQRLMMNNNRSIELMHETFSANRLKAIGMAASKIIHDIKSPLTVIVLTAQLIESIFPDSSEFTGSIVMQAKLVDELVRETLDYASGTQSAPNLQKVDLDAMFQSLKETYGTSLKGRDIDLKVENKCTDPVYFDENKIRRVLLNLIKNSSEALEDTGEIKLTASLSSNWLQISVSDNGPGVEPSILEDLFKPFVSFGKTTGTGLGLAICSKLVEEHQGRLEYQPVQPHGSRFDIRIPQNLK